MFTRTSTFVLLVLAAPVSAGDRTPQVVGGQPVQSGQFPFVVALVEGSELACTGSLIRPNWVLTAAHCAIDGRAPSHVAISDMEPQVLGADHTVTLIPSAQWIPHPGYDAETSQNDVALIRLGQDATANPPRLNGSALYTPQVIQLASSPLSTGASIGNVEIVGFGQDDTGELPRVAMWAAGLPTFPAAVCEAESQLPVSETQQLCYASYPNACFGDSGGPVFRTVSGTRTQVGVVSYGPEDCGTGPSVATFVPGHVAWINQQIDGTPPASPIQYGWELPPSTQDGVATGVSNAQGWAFSSAGTITSIRLERNGQHFATLPCCAERGDVRTVIPAAPLLSGFSAAISWGNLGNGTSNLTLVIRDSAGNERRDTRPVRSVQLLNGVPFSSNLGFGQNSQCEFGFLSGSTRAAAECTGLTFQQGACNGTITFAWLNGKQAFEVVEGCH